MFCWCIRSWWLDPLKGNLLTLNHVDFCLNIQWHGSVPKAQPVTMHRYSSSTACWQSGRPRPRLLFKWFGLCCLMTPGLSKDIRCHVWPYFFKLENSQIRHHPTHKMGCQPGVCIWSLEVTYSLMTLEGNSLSGYWNLMYFCVLLCMEL